MRARRTKAAVADLGQAIKDVLAQESQQTVRQVFYRLVAAGAIEKTELSYRVVVRLLTLLREDRRVDFDSVADTTRRAMQPVNYNDVDEAIGALSRGYRRDPWQEQSERVEVWLEKDALGGILYSVTSRFDVPLMICRGFPSITFLHDSAQEIASVGKPTTLLYFGDHDPSGEDITRAVDEGVRRYSGFADVLLEKIAVDERQIQAMALPTRPTKSSDPRTPNWTGDGSVELDAIPPSVIRSLVTDAIEAHIDPAAWKASKRIEARERDELQNFLARDR